MNFYVCSYPRCPHIADDVHVAALHSLYTHGAVYHIKVPELNYKEEVAVHTLAKMRKTKV